MNKYPQKTKSDSAIDLVKAGVQLVPFGIGGAITQLYDSFFPVGFEKRKSDWLKCLAEKLEKLPEEIAMELSKYLNTEEGKTLLIRAGRSAFSTHKEEKYKVLRDVLLSSVADSSIHYDQKEMYMDIISDLEPYDVALLSSIHSNHEKYGKIESYEEAYKLSLQFGFNGSRDEFILIINKLENKSLIRITDDIDGFGDVYSTNAIIDESTSDMPKIKVTEIAIKLVSYITKPV